MHSRQREDKNTCTSYGRYLKKPECSIGPRPWPRSFAHTRWLGWLYTLMHSLGSPPIVSAVANDRCGRDENDGYMRTKTDYSIKWSILKTSATYSIQINDVCLLEKFPIIIADMIWAHFQIPPWEQILSRSHMNTILLWTTNWSQINTIVSVTCCSYNKGRNIFHRIKAYQSQTAVKPQLK